MCDRVPRSLTLEQVETLRALGRQAIAQLELRRHVTALARTNEQLQEVSRLKSEFLTNMSHELRTPLTSILGFSSVLLQQIFGTLTAKQQEYLSCIHSSGEHLLSLINDLLDLAKIEAGKLELRPEAVDVVELCQDALQMMQVRADAKHQHLSLKLPVATGIGIPPDEQHLLFQTFQQLDGAINRQYAGTALGLVLTRRLAELHGGTVSFTSTLGVGSTFSVWLPMR